MTWVLNATDEYLIWFDTLDSEAKQALVLT